MGLIPLVFCFQKIVSLKRSYFGLGVQYFDTIRAAVYRFVCYQKTISAKVDSTATLYSALVVDAENLVLYERIVF